MLLVVVVSVRMQVVVLSYAAIVTGLVVKNVGVAVAVVLRMVVLSCVVAGMAVALADVDHLTSLLMGCSRSLPQSHLTVLFGVLYSQPCH